MPPRVLEEERLRHKVLISLNDDQYGMLLDEARRRNLATSIIARLAVVEGLPALCRQGRAAWRRADGGTRGEGAGTA